MFNSKSWTGGAVSTLEAPRPALKSAKPSRESVTASKKAHMDEYAELAAITGIAPPDLVIESFKEFLEANNITVFSLTEVISYMDNLAAKESKEKCGWEWRPLREKDHCDFMVFGTAPERIGRNWGGISPADIKTIPASDHYNGGGEEKNYVTPSGQNHAWKVSSSQKPYDRTIPLHALRKVAKIEKEFSAGAVSFFVSDYALAPAIQYPDPFLMAVINNPAVNKGIGRFIIDFWDEPGFGLDKQLA